MTNFIAICFLLGYVFGSGAVIVYVLAKTLSVILQAMAAK